MLQLTHDTERLAIREKEDDDLLYARVAGLRCRKPGTARSIERLVKPEGLPKLQLGETVKSSVQRH